MKKLVLLLAFVLFSSNVAHAQSGLYLAPTISLGAQSAHFKGDTSSTDSVDINPKGITLGFGLRAGFDMMPTSKVPLRVEGEYSIFTRTDCEFGSEYQMATLDINTLFVNFYYDFHKKDNPIVPYIGAGMGMYFANLNTGSLDTMSSNDMAFNVTAGVAMKMSDNFALDFGYRYVGLNDLPFLYYFNTTGKQHLFSTTARIYF